MEHHGFARLSLPIRAGSVWLWLLLSLWTVASCASKSPSPQAANQTVSNSDQARQSNDPEAAGPTAAPAQGAASSPSRKQERQSAEDEPHVSGPTACAPEMVLVEGEYCTALSNEHDADASGNTPGAGAPDIEVVERECLKEWYAPQNKKRVCEEFATKGRCIGKMVKKRFCMDRYAWPNQRGVKAEVMNRFHQAQIKCAALDKRLCTESEWTFACEGPKMKPFPYGYVRDAKKCHGDEPWDSPNMTKVAQRDQAELRRLYKGKPSGQPGCVSDFGVYDLPGNTDEVVASETFESGWRGKYDSVHTGGPWYQGVRNQCRPKIYTHDEGFYYYFLSFRCCSAADGASTDPLTPKQKENGWDMSRVERLAGVTVAEMKSMLEKKKTDPSCGCTTTKCRTLCGTLLGTEDGDTSPPAP